MDGKVNEDDWILFRNRVGGWQDRCYEKLTQKYRNILNSRRKASDQFRLLSRAVEKDAYTRSLTLNMSRSGMVYDILTLLSEGVITLTDLDGFSVEVREKVASYVKMMENKGNKRNPGPDEEECGEIYQKGVRKREKGASADEEKI